MRAFEQALEIDPGSVDAWVGIATVLGERLAVGWSKSREQDMARCDRLLREALERDRSNPRALAELGRLRRIQNRLIEAQIELEKAIAIDRNNARAINQLGITLLFQGRPKAAFPHLEKCFQLNTERYQNVFYNYIWLGYRHLLMSNADKAVNLLRKARAANPQLWGTHSLLAAALGLRGDIDEVQSALAEAVNLNPEINSVARLRASYSAMSNPQFVVIWDKTAGVGLRRAGFPD